MKVLHVTDHYTVQGGVQQYILSVARLLAEHGHQNAVLYTEDSSETIRDGGWPAYCIDPRAGVSAQMQRVLDLERPDVAYVHHVAYPAVIEDIGSRLPSVAYVHGFTAVCPGLGKYFRRGDVVCERAFGVGCVPMHYLRRCSAARHPRTLQRMMRNTAALKQALLQLPRLLVGSQYMVALLIQNGFSSGQIGTLPPHFIPDATVLTYEPPAEVHSLLYAGRLEIEKGFPYLLHALTQLPEHVHLVVAGDGTQRRRYEELAREFGLATRVEFLGWLNTAGMLERYRQAALVVLPTICPESFGKSGVEAHSMGRPVVAFNVGGVSDWLQDGVNGSLVPPRDVSGLARAIMDLLSNPARSAAVGRNGQRMVGERFRASEHLNDLLQAFEKARDGFH